MTHRATYSPEDNKLRLYPDWTDGEFDKEEAKKLGFKWASKQECYVKPKWSPRAEDYLLTLVDEIEDEDYSPVERAADRAERFSGYRDKRMAEATGSADTYDAGGSVFGNQSAARAERQARKHDRHRTKAVSQWSKAEYWQYRTKGVLSHALHRAKPAVRRSRILKLESEQRSHEANRREHREIWDSWNEIASMQGSDQLIPLNESGYGVAPGANEAQVRAYKLANTSKYRVHFEHPDSHDANEKAKQVQGNYWSGFSAYELLTRDEYCGASFRRLSPKEFAELFISNVTHPDEYGKRWSDHYENRLAYENAMLENEGGKVSELDIEPGGWIRGSNRGVSSCLESVDAGWIQVVGVNKSPKTGRVTSVKVWGRTTGYTPESNYTKQETRKTLVTMNIERLGEESYRPPTDEERDAFKVEQKAIKTKRKTVSLINPTKEDAARLQAFRNNCNKGKEPTEVVEMTQAKYSFLSKGDAVNTVMIAADGKRTRDQSKAVCKIRQSWQIYGADRVIVLTDKPQKSLPLDWSVIETEETKPQVPGDDAIIHQDENGITYDGAKVAAAR